MSSTLGIYSANTIGRKNFRPTKAATKHYLFLTSQKYGHLALVHVWRSLLHRRRQAYGGRWEAKSVNFLVKRGAFCGASRLNRDGQKKQQSISKKEAFWAQRVTSKHALKHKADCWKCADFFSQIPLSRFLPHKR